MRVKLSIIISAFNMEKYIDRCLLSVVEQTCTEFEVILLNDGSTDNTLEKCESWARKDSRIKLINKVNEGLGESRNRGIYMAAGEYVTFLDADDWLAEDFVENMLAGTQNGLNDIVICDMCFVEKDYAQEKERVSAVRLPQGKIKVNDERYLLSRARTFMCSKMFRKDLFTVNDVKIPAHAFEDISVVPYLVSKAEYIYYIHKGMYYYLRNREGSIINDFSKLFYTVASLEELLNRFKSEGTFEKYRTQLRNLFWGQVCHVWNVTNGKFAFSDMNEINVIRKGIVDSFCRFFEEGSMLSSIKYYAGDSEILNDAIKHLILTDEQLVRNESEVDCVVVIKSDEQRISRNTKMFQKSLQLFLNKDYCDDAESMSWNLADEILSQMFSER